MAGTGGRAGEPDATGVEAASAPERSQASRCMPFEDCVAGIKSALKDPTVRFLRERMEKAGCPMPPGMITAKNCGTADKSGSYGSTVGIMVCCEEMRYQDEISQLLIHELVHAYDDCVVKNMDWKNCAHHACSEIRANHLSGDCHYKRELLRGFMKIRGHEQGPTHQKTQVLKGVEKHLMILEKVADDSLLLDKHYKLTHWGNLNMEIILINDLFNN